MKYDILYEGPLVSNNKFYSGMHWASRKKLVDQYHLIFSALLKQGKIPKFEQFELKMRYNSRHDCDNISATAKLFVDTLKGKYTPDDTTKYFKGFEIRHDDSLKKNTTIFSIIINGNNEG